MTALNSAVASARLKHLREIFEPVVREGLSVELLVALLTIAIEPGVSVNELAERLNAPQQTASRYASILLGRYQEPALAKQQYKEPLVTQQVHSDDPRKRAMFLTERGEKFVADLLSLLNSK